MKPALHCAFALLIVASAQAATNEHQNGWILLTDSVAAHLPDAPMKQYLYSYEDRWYLSPRTSIVWSWSFGQQLAGTYTYFDGSAVGSFSCSGSDEIPWWGVGCSDGPGAMPKVLTIYASDPANGQGIVCQDVPDAFGIGTCAWATVYVRFRPASENLLKLP